VQCTEDGNCPANLSHCREGTCVECVNDKQCPTDRPKCENHACVAGK
jgi:hypothetical protein